MHMGAAGDGQYLLAFAHREGACSLRTVDVPELTAEQARRLQYAVLHLGWRTRSGKRLRTRFLHLLDSQVDYSRNWAHDFGIVIHCQPWIDTCGWNANDLGHANSHSKNQDETEVDGVADSNGDGSFCVGGCDSYDDAKQVCA